MKKFSKQFISIFLSFLIIINNSGFLNVFAEDVSAPNGYSTAETINFTIKDTDEIQKVEMQDKPIKVEISKTDITNGKELPGATLVVKDKQGNIIEQWVSTDKPHLINKLPVGDYTLTEITAPSGYKVAETINFTVKDTDEIQKVQMKDAHEDIKPVDSPAKPAASPIIMPGNNNQVIKNTSAYSDLLIYITALFVSLGGLIILLKLKNNKKQ